MTGDVSGVEFVSQAVAWYQQAAERQERLRRESDLAGLDKALAAKALHDRAGMSYVEIGRALDVSPARVGQMIASVTALLGEAVTTDG